MSASENPNKIILGFGLEDGFAESNQLLANQLPTRNVFRVSGGHDWATWKTIWTKVLDHYHVACSGANGAFCHIEVLRIDEGR